MRIKYISLALKAEVMQLEGGVAAQSTTVNPGNPNRDIIDDDFEEDSDGTIFFLNF